MDEAQFETFVLGTQEKALGLAHAHLGDWEEARDAVQEAFVRTYRSLRGFRGEAEVGTWFYRILVNHCSDRLRRRRARGWLTFWRSAEEAQAAEALADPRPTPTADLEERDFRRALGRAIAALPRRQAEVIRLRALAGLPLAEIAAALCLSEGAVKSHLFRATRRLQEVLAPWRDGS